MTYNASHRKDVRKAEKDESRQFKEDREVLRSITSTSAGRSWLWRHLSDCHVFIPSWAGDVNQLLFTEGERNRGLALLTEITIHCPEALTLMMGEANARDTDAVGTDDSSADSDEPGTD